MRIYTIHIFIVIFFTIPSKSISQVKYSLEGANKYSKTIIQKLLHQPDKDKLLKLQEIGTFRETLNQHGYINHQIDSTYTKDSVIHYFFDLKKKISTIEMKFPSSNDKNIFPEFEFINNTIEIPIHKIPSIINRVTNYYSKKGYVFTEVHLENIRKKDLGITADLIISKKKKRFIDNIIVNGYEKFPKAFITNDLEIKIGAIFDKKNISKTADKIKQLSFVSEIRKPEILFTKDSTSVYLYLKKETSNSFDGLIGFSNKEEGNGISLQGFLDLKIKNALDKGESLELDWHKTAVKSQSLDVSLHYPYIFNTPFSTSYKLNIYKKDSSFVNLTNNLIIDYKVRGNTKIGLALESTNSNQTTNIDEVDFKSFYYGISYSYKKPRIHPVFKNKYIIETSILQGKRNSEQQTRIASRLEYIFRLNHKQYISIGNNTSFLLSETYLENELYRIGGSKSIRGFDEQSFSANLFSYLNFEYAYLVQDTTYLSALSDFGLIQHPSLKSSIQTYSFGFGYSFKTKMGQLGLQYFIGNTMGSPFSLGNSKLHIRLSQEF